MVETIVVIDDLPASSPVQLLPSLRLLLNLASEALAATRATAATAL